MEISTVIISPKGKFVFLRDNAIITWRSRDHGQNTRPRAPPAAFGLTRPSVYGSPQAAGGALGRAFWP